MKITKTAASGACREDDVSQIGNQASGDTGRRSWITGLTACQARLLAPMSKPERDADQRGQAEAGEHPLERAPAAQADALVVGPVVVERDRPAASCSCGEASPPASGRLGDRDATELPDASSTAAARAPPSATAAARPADRAARPGPVGRRGRPAAEHRPGRAAGSRPRARRRGRAVMRGSTSAIGVGGIEGGAVELRPRTAPCRRRGRRCPPPRPPPRRGRVRISSSASSWYGGSSLSSPKRWYWAMNQMAWPLAGGVDLRRRGRTASVVGVGPARRDRPPRSYIAEQPALDLRRRGVDVVSTPMVSAACARLSRSSSHLLALRTAPITSLSTSGRSSANFR